MSKSNPFKPAQKSVNYLRMAITGPAGSGKSLTALRIAHTIADGGKVAAFDTNGDKLSNYAGWPNPDGGLLGFDILCDAATPDNVIGIIQEAEDAVAERLDAYGVPTETPGQAGALTAGDKAKTARALGISRVGPDRAPGVDRRPGARLREPDKRFPGPHDHRRVAKRRRRRVRRGRRFG